MERDFVLNVMTFTLRVGEAMLESSVATSDVEEAMRRVTAAFGLGRCEVSITLNVITLCYVNSALGGPITLVKGVDIGEPQLDRLVALEELARSVEAKKVTIAEASERIDAIVEAGPGHARWITTLATFVSVAAWVVFAGGGLLGALAGVTAALAVELVVRPLERTRIPAVFLLALSAALFVTFPTLIAWAGASIALTPAIVGGLYVLLPGGALVASVTDGLSGAPLSSMAKALQATLTAGAIAVGVITMTRIANELDIYRSTAEPATPYLVSLAAATVAVAALSVARCMPWRFVPVTAAIAAATWVLARLAVDWISLVAPSAFLAAVVVGLGGSVAARFLRTTQVVFTTTAVYVLVPGVLFYESMVAFAVGDTDAAIDGLVNALGIAAAVAAGVALGVAVGRSVPTPRNRALLWRRPVRR